MMPPENLFGPAQEPPPEIAEHLRRVDAACQEFEISRREMVLAWASVLCSCRPWYISAGRGEPPQRGCTVHGNVMVTMDGRAF